MSGQNLYYDWVSVLQAAGCRVAVGSQNEGWERRARSSGGFPVPPLGVWWHHTASDTEIENDLAWQCHSCPDKPVGNMTLARDGTFWPVAGGASNCAGKGGPWNFSRGQVAQDQGNVYGVQIEVANNGIGEPWPQVQIDEYFRGSNAINRMLGNQPTDVVTHRRWAPDRKIDPATASAVQGPWQPGSETSSGTWMLDDIQAECSRRAGVTPGPRPPIGDDDDMLKGIYKSNGPALYVCYTGGNKLFITDDGMWNGAIALCQKNGVDPNAVTVEPGEFAAMGIVSGPRPPGTDEWGNYL